MTQALALGHHLAQDVTLRDVRSNIFAWLPSKSLAKVMQVCQLWLKESNND